MKIYWLKAFFLSGAAISCFNCFADTDFHREGRYFLKKIVMAAEQRDPLQQMVQINFPPSVVSIESAYRYVLLPTGYQLAGFNSIDQRFAVMAANPLPISQRNLQGRVIDILGVLAGDDFVVVRDDLTRLVAIDAKIRG